MFDRFMHFICCFGFLADPKAAIGRRFVIRGINYSEQYSVKLLEYLRKHKFKKLGIVKAEFSFFNALLDGLNNNLKPDEKLEIIDSYTGKDQDFRSTVTKLRAKKFDIIGVYLLPNQIPAFYRQASEQGLKLKAFGATPFESQKLREELGHMLDGVVYTQNVVKPDFQKAYLTKFGDDVQIGYAAHSYELALLIGELFNAPGLSRLSAEKIIDAFKGVDRKDSVAGPYKFKNPEQIGMFFDFPIGLKRILAGRAEVIEED